MVVTDTSRLRLAVAPAVRWPRVLLGQEGPPQEGVRSSGHSAFFPLRVESPLMSATAGVGVVSPPALGCFVPWMVDGWAGGPHTLTSIAGRVGRATDLFALPEWRYFVLVGGVRSGRRTLSPVGFRLGLPAPRPLVTPPKMTASGVRAMR